MIRYTLKDKNTGMYVETYDRFRVVYTRRRSNAIVENWTDIQADAEAIKALFNANLCYVVAEV